MGEVRGGMGKILERLGGREIPPSRNGDLLGWGLLGANVHYSRNRGIVRLCMNDYVRKLWSRYAVTIGDKDPNFADLDVNSQVDEVSVNIREVVGALQWAVTMARPDIARPVNILSRYSAQQCAKSRLEAGKRIMGYLLRTEFRGVVYSPWGGE